MLTETVTSGTAADSLPGILKIVSEGGDLVLLAVILLTLLRHAPRMAQQIADSHTAAIKDLTEGKKEAAKVMADAQVKAVELFRADSQEARQAFRGEMQAAREQHATLMREERDACDKRHEALEHRLDRHEEALRALTNTVRPQPG